MNNGRRWDVINIEDPTKPTRVGRFETDSPGRAVHDVWVRDGIAYHAGWTDGQDHLERWSVDLANYGQTVRTIRVTPNGEATGS